MKKIRIGNDIRITWALQRNGEDAPLENAEVSLLSQLTREKMPFDYVIAGNKVMGTFYGKDQKSTGGYTLLIEVNKGVEDMHTLDHTDAFILVDTSSKANYVEGVASCVELTDDLAYAKDGLSAYEIAVLHGYVGTEEEWINAQMQAEQKADRALQAADKANDDIDKTTMRVYRDGGYNMDQCLWYGWWFGCTSGRPEGSEDGEEYALEVVNLGTKAVEVEADEDITSNYPQLRKIGADGGWQGTFGYYQFSEGEIIHQFVERYYGNYPARDEEVCRITIDIPNGRYSVTMLVAASCTRERDTWLTPPDPKSPAFSLYANGQVFTYDEGKRRGVQRIAITDIEDVGVHNTEVTVTNGSLTLILAAGYANTANWFILGVPELRCLSREEDFMAIKQTCHSTLDARKEYRRLIYTRDRNVYEPPTTIYQPWQAPYSIGNDEV